MKLFLASSLQHTGKHIAKTLLKDGLIGKVMFLTTASEGEKGDLSWLDADRQPLQDAGLDVFDYSITNKSPEEIHSALEGLGAICVAGGNTYYLLDQMRKTRFDTIVTNLVKNGLPYIGSSAGALVAGPTIQTSLDDPSITPKLTDYSGLNLCSISIRPHWGSDHFAERYREEYLRLFKLQVSMIVLLDQDYVVVEDSSFKLIST
jgi:dipeptidase E